MTSEPSPTDLHLAWLDLDVPAGSRLVEARFWEREAGHHAVGEAAGAILVELPDESLAFHIRHVRPEHADQKPAYGGTGRVDYIDELEILWLAFDRDADITTDDWDTAVAVTTSLGTDGTLGEPR